VKHSPTMLIFIDTLVALDGFYADAAFIGGA
jgi:hypothetical protein